MSARRGTRSEPRGGDSVRPMTMLRLETDYLVIGAGAAGMGFTDVLIEHSDADVIMVDRRHAAGGHWLDAYPFVRLHAPSAMYGVNSTPLGRDRITTDGPEAGFYERASGPEVCGYFDDVMNHRLLASGRVRFHPSCEYLGERRFRSNVTGEEYEVDVRVAVVDASNDGAGVPATHAPPFDVSDGAHCIPVGELVRTHERPARYTVIGAGKTAMDACSWLLERGTDPTMIRWIRPRDPWIQDRAFLQPRAQVVSLMRWSVYQLEALAAAESIADAMLRIEDSGVHVRLDPDVEPTMAKGPVVSLGELEQLRRIEDVVRLGRVERIEADRIVLEQGSVPAGPDHLHVHCATSGISPRAPRPIFSEGQISIQPVGRSLVFCGTLIGFIESTGRSLEQKNRLCWPLGPMDTPYDWLRWLIGSIDLSAAWGAEDDVRTWLQTARMDPMMGLANPEHAEALAELQPRFLEAIGPAKEKWAKLSADATPAERDRSFDPATLT